VNVSKIKYMINDTSSQSPKLSKIQELRKKYNELLPGKESLIKLLGETEVSEQVYNSNAIENSSLTLEETDKILLKIDLDRYINERELFEAKNLARVVEYINLRAKEKELDLEMILLLHKILISNINDDIAGRFRVKEWVRVGQYVAPDPEEVIPLMTKLLAEYYGSSDPIDLKIAKFHLGFEHIHPFVDGNGRIGRVLNNYLLIREGFVPIILSFADRPMYYQSFKEFQKEKTPQTMLELVNKAIINSYNKRIAYFDGKKIVRLSQYAKTSKQSLPNLINKANRQTIPAFRDKGVWMIGAEKDFALDRQKLK
jgi:Fic family protein